MEPLVADNRKCYTWKGREDAGENYFSNFKDTDLRVDYTGNHYWSTVGELKVAASLNFRQYPYDV